ncbi:MAG: NAD(P)-dependent alcohol dehydrogenase [Beijerinckiaceae bacterium]|nr:NAD(P)-dependent alcohol dehydrogenase [Beijerinckiaceae bacterium]
MRVFQIEGGWSFDHLVLAERPDPVPQAGQVLVRMHAAALNARDLIVPLRGYGRATGELPLIPVSDGVGTVVGIGPGVTRVTVGDRVCPTYFQGWISGEPSAERFATALGGPLDGVMADLVCLSEEGVVRVPDYLTHAEAATLPCAALTAWSAVAGLAATRPGDHVLIQGTGGVALFALAFAKLHGAHVTVISSSDAKLERARALGADATINYQATPEWSRPARDIAAGRGGFDTIIELGGEATLAQSIKCIRVGGTIALIGVLSGLTPALPLGAIVTRQVRLQGVTVGHRDGFEAMLRAMALHQVRPVIGKVFAFAELRAALDETAKPSGLGKTIIRFDAHDS